MLRHWLLAALALTLLLPAAPSQAASTMQTHLDWTEGSFEVGTAGAGKAVFPEFVEAPDHERISFPVNPCHRQLSLGLDYQPRNASARLSHEGNAAEVILPYRFQAGLIAPNGTVLHRIVVEEPDLSIPFGIAEEPGEYTLELELLEGAMVDWEVRVRGFAAYDEPTCDVWLNEVETNADEGGDWVELYNEGSQAVNLSGWRLAADKTNAEIPVEELVLGAGEHRLVETESGAFAPVDERVSLLGPSGSPFEASPALTDKANDNRTWQKAGDGLGDWIFEPGTPGEPNVG